jgi:predicted RNase H-like HicB family nuclease
VTTASPSSIRLDFQVLIYPEDGVWIAHCLEMDVAESGATPKAAVEALIDVANVLVEDAIRSGSLDSIFHSAPKEVWSLYANAPDDVAMASPPRKLAAPVNRIQFRNLAPAY